jgi:hypothetical protein
MSRRLLLIWLALLLAAPVAAYFLAGETEVVVSVKSGAVWAEVHGTRLDVPADMWDLSKAGGLKLPEMSQLRVEGSSSSLYWQPAQGDLLYPVGLAGEWLQNVRPPAQWTGSRVGSDGSTIYKLKGGRALALLPLDDGTGNGLVLEVRPERATMAWLALQGGQPGEELDSTSYRPSGLVSAGDLVSEVALVAWVASLLGVLAWLGGLGIARLYESGAKRDAAATTPPRRLAWLDRPAYPAIALLLAGTVLASVVCIAVLEGIPHVQDDVAYLFQAKIFALGRSWVPAPPAPEFFQNGFVEIFEGRWFSKYPPGYPLLLVPGLWAGMPWLINALSCGVSLALTYMAGLRMFGRHVAAWAGLLGLISPWVLFMSGSYMSHPTTMMWAALFLYALVGLRLSFRADGEGGLFGKASRWGLLAGFAIGMAFITREWTAVGIGVGAAVWAVGDILLSRVKLRKVVPYSFVLVGFLPPLFLLLYENHALTGNWFRLAQDLVGSYDTPGFGPGHGSPQGHTPAMGLYNGLVYLRTLATVFDGWPAPFALAPIVLGLFAWAWNGARRLLAWDSLSWLSLAGLLGAYFLWWSSTTIYGPRYWYEGMPFMLLMAGRGMDLLGRVASHTLEGVWAARVRWLVPGGLFALFSVYTLTQTLPAQARSYVDYNDISGDAVREVEGAHLTNAIVFVALEPSRPNRDYGKVFFANDPLLQGNIVYARDRGAAANRHLASLFPGRAAYWLPLQGPPQPGPGP